MDIRKIVTTGFVAVALTASFGANAAFVKDTHRTMVVNLSDLSVDSKRDEQVMHARLKQAARQVCGSNDVPSGSLTAASKKRSCYNEALANAMDQIDSRYVTVAE